MKIVKHGQVIDVPITSLANAMIRFRGWELVGDDEPTPRSDRDDCNHGHSFAFEKEHSVACIDDEGTQ